MAILFSKKQVPYAHWEVIHVDTGDRLRIVPERGGLITEWCCKGREILYFDLERFKQTEKSVRGGIPILFPICGDLPGNILKLDNQEYSINQHGFARNSSWTINLLEGQSSFSISLSDDEKTRALYPYSFLLNIEIRLERNSIGFTINVHNKSPNQMPFTFGLHPYFNVTDLKKTKLHGLAPTCFDHIKKIDGPTEDQLGRLPKGVDFITGPSKSVALVDLLTGSILEMQQEVPFDLTVVWTDPPRQMVCLEPWTSPRESLINGKRRLFLDPGTKQTLNCRLKIN